jgi:TonB-dependent receptor
MAHRNFWGLMVSGASCAMVAAICTPACAADAAPGDAAPASAADATDGAAIVVTGLRGSLQRNLDIKKDAAGVLDAISAEDIGKFPDPNVAASLQRLPGVTVQLSGPRGEATGVTVRGFSGDFNETLYDGRHISTGTGNRSVDFSTVGSDFVGRISVYKTPDVSISSGSIGATIDVAFPKPFDKPGLRLATTVSGTDQPGAKKAGFSGGVLLSDAFADNTFGVLADVAYSSHYTRTNHVEIAGWEGGNVAPCQLAGSPDAATCNPTTAGPGVPAANAETVKNWFPQQSVVEQLRTRDERIDGRLALQWKPSDKVLLTLDDNFSRQTVETDSYGFAAWFTRTDLRNITQDSNGTAINFSQPPQSDSAGGQVGQDFNDGINHSILQTNQLGLNLKYQVNDHFKLDLDGALSRSWLNPNGEHTNDNGDIGYAGLLGSNVGQEILGDSKNHLPVLTGLGPNGDASQFLSQADLGSHVLVRQAQRNTDLVKQFHLKGLWEQDNFKLRFGAGYVQDKFNLQESDTFTNNYWQSFAGYGAPSGRTSGLNPLPSSLFQGTLNTQNWLPGYQGGALLPGLIIYNPQQLYSILEGLGNPQAMNIPAFNYGSSTTYTGMLDLALSPSSVQQIKETTWSAYVAGTFDNQIGTLPFHFTSGLRYENTTVNALALGQDPVSLTRSAADPSLLTIGYANGGATTPIPASHSYNYLLPSFDLKLEAAKNLTVRFDASRTLTRPALNLLNGALSVPVGQRIGALNASGGNPNLQPYLSDNFDGAVEWYYQRNSYVSVDVFLKHVSNFIIGGVTTQTINDIIDPTTGQKAVFSVSQQVNGPDATIRGVELALQQVFGQSGFGFTLNGTFVGTNKPYDPSNIGTSGFAVTGLANSANLVAFYDKHGFQARVAVNWRDSYLLQFGQNQNNSLYGSEPTFVNSQIQVDLSSSYDINKQFQIFGGVTNLNNSTYSTHGRYSNQFLDAYGYGRRFTFGARFHY